MRPFLRHRTAALIAALMTLAGLTAGPASTDTTWRAPQNVSNPGIDAAMPHLHMSSDGQQLTAVWFEGVEDQMAVMTSRSADAGVTWSAPTALSAPGANNYLPQIAGSSDGMRLAVAWDNNPGEEGAVQVATSADAGSTWTAPRTLGADGSGDARIVAAQDGSRYTALWNQRTGDGRSALLASTSSDGGGTWSEPVDVSVSGTYATLAEFTASEDGRTVFAAWEQSAPEDKLVLMAAVSRDGGTTWPQPVVVAAKDRTTMFQDVVASADATRLTVAWTGFGDGPAAINVATSTDGVAWSTPQVLSNPAEIAGWPQLVMSSDGGRLAAVWTVLKAGSWYADSAYSTDGGSTWSPPQTITGTDQHIFEPRVAASRNGKRISAIWQAVTETPQIRLASSVDGGATWSAPVTLSEGAAEYLGFPTVAASQNGRRIAGAWSRYTDDLGSVQVTTGYTPAPEVSAQPVDFGRVVRGLAETRTVTVTNTGDAGLRVSSLRIEGKQIRLGTQECTGRDVAPQASCEVMIRFVPGPRGPVSGALVLTDNTDAESTRVPLNGQSIALQRPLGQRGLPPEEIGLSGVTVLTGKNARTNSGQRIRTKVAAGTTAAGEVRYFRVIRGPKGKVSLRTYGHKNLKVVLVQSAPATAEFTAYRKRTVYVGGVRR